METLRRYWCFACQNHFQTQKEPSCTLCHSEAVQLDSGNNNAPSQFSAYQIQHQQQQQPTQQNQQQTNQVEANSENLIFDNFIPIVFHQISVPLTPRLRIIHFVNLDEMVNPFQQIMGGQDGLLNLLNSLRQQGNLVRATKQEINRLEKVDNVKDCSVCQQEQCDPSRKGYKLTCGHTFHTDCLDPWLERTNTCPTCRQHI